MVREELRLGKSQLAEWRMESAWSGLDKDKSGFITMQEFGDFMKRGKPEKGPTWKERLQAEQDEKGRQARLEKQTTSGRFVSTAEPADAEELQRLSTLLRAQLEDPSSWSAVFRQADSDGSGNITFAEFSGEMRVRRPVRARACVLNRSAPPWCVC